MEKVHAENGDTLDFESFEAGEILVIVEGCISLQRGDCDDAEFHVATETVGIPAGVPRSITAHETPTYLVLIHPRTAS